MTDTSRETLSAQPAYRVAQRVRYYDRQGRAQTGEVRRIEASWNGYGDGPVDPLIVYSLWYPTYRGNNFYCTDDAIIGGAA